MPTLDTLLAFFGVSLLLGITPGPDNLFVLVQSAQRGWRAGMAVVVGLCAGLVVHTAAVALGLAALFAASATAFTVLKYLGAAYLAWLAWQSLRPRPEAMQNAADPDRASQSFAGTLRMSASTRLPRAGSISGFQFSSTSPTTSGALHTSNMSQPAL